MLVCYIYKHMGYKTVKKKKSVGATILIAVSLGLYMNTQEEQSRQRN